MDIGLSAAKPGCLLWDQRFPSFSHQRDSGLLGASLSPPPPPPLSPSLSWCPHLPPPPNTKLHPQLLCSRILKLNINNNHFLYLILLSDSPHRSLPAFYTAPSPPHPPHTPYPPHPHPILVPDLIGLLSILTFSVSFFCTHPSFFPTPHHLLHHFIFSSAIPVSPPFYSVS